MKFEWDSAKDVSNQKKHGITFEEAVTAFDDPFALIAPDPKHSTKSEVREWLIGESDMGVLVIIFTIRQPGSTYRIISARHANKKEKKQYEETKKLSL